MWQATVLSIDRPVKAKLDMKLSEPYHRDQRFRGDKSQYANHFSCAIFSPLYQLCENITYL